MHKSPNLLLASLPHVVLAAVEPLLKTVRLEFGEILAEPGSQVRRVYFPHSGVVSLVVEMRDGGMIETAMVGRDGIVNAASALDGEMSLNKAIVQVAGQASVMATGRLRKLAAEFGVLRSLLIRHEQVVLAQAQQSAACNADHLVEARMCRWLLRMRDLAEADDLQLTQEFLAQMLGVRRTSVTLVASTLQKAGFIQYHRGNITLLDVERIRETACECYATVRDHYENMLNSKGHR